MVGVLASRLLPFVGARSAMLLRRLSLYRFPADGVVLRGLRPRRAGAGAGHAGHEAAHRPRPAPPPVRARALHGARRTRRLLPPGDGAAGVGGQRRRPVAAGHGIRRSRYSG